MMNPAAGWRLRWAAAAILGGPGQSANFPVPERDGHRWRDAAEAVSVLPRFGSLLAQNHANFGFGTTSLLAQQDSHARVRGQTDRRNIAFRRPPVLRGIP